MASYSGDTKHRRGNSEANLADIYNKQIKDMKEHIKRLEKQLK
jgi:hypothetical protein